MTRSTLKRLAFIALLGLAACSASSDTSDASADTGLPDPSGWRLASGRVPTNAEFGALVATCQDRGGAFDPCLTTLGLKRGQ
jgi:hypothetical protein